MVKWGAGSAKTWEERKQKGGNRDGANAVFVLEILLAALIPLHG